MAVGRPDKPQVGWVQNCQVTQIRGFCLNQSTQFHHKPHWVEHSSAPCKEYYNSLQLLCERTVFGPKRWELSSTHSCKLWAKCTRKSPKPLQPPQGCPAGYSCHAPLQKPTHTWGQAPKRHERTGQLSQDTATHQLGAAHGFVPQGRGSVSLGRPRLRAGQLAGNSLVPHCSLWEHPVQEGLPEHLPHLLVGWHLVAVQHGARVVPDLVAIADPQAGGTRGCHDVLPVGTPSKVRGVWGHRLGDELVVFHVPHFHLSPEVSKACQH